MPSEFSRTTLSVQAERGTEYKYWEDHCVNISAIGEALTALDAEYDKLDEEVKNLFARAGLAMKKQKACVDAIKKLLAASNGGVYPEARDWPKFPELN